MISRQRSRFFRYVLSICDNTVREDSGYELSNDTKISPPTSSFVGDRKLEQIAKLLDFPHTTDELCYKVFRINNFQWQSCSGMCLENKCEKVLKSMHIYSFHNDFSAPLD